MDRGAIIQALWESDRLECLAELDRLLEAGAVAEAVGSAVWPHVCRVYACQTEDPPIYVPVCQLMHRHRRVLAEEYLRIPEEPSISRVDRRLMLRMDSLGIEEHVFDVFKLLSTIRYPSLPELSPADHELLEMCVVRMEVEVEEQLVCSLDGRWLQTSLRDESVIDGVQVVYRRTADSVVVAVDGHEQAFDIHSMVALHAVVRGLPIAMHLGKFMRLVKLDAVHEVYRRMMMSGCCTVIRCRLGKTGLVRGLGQQVAGCTYLPFADPQGSLAIVKAKADSAEMIYPDSQPNPRNLFEAAVNIIYRLQQ